MVQDKVIYTDGHDVTVTDSTLKVKNTAYSINGITKLYLWTIRPDRWPGVLMMLLGVVALLCGWMGVFPANADVGTGSNTVDSNMLALWVGAGLFLLGIIILAMTKERYAVRIATAEGEKNALVSTKREYVAQIVDAVNKAFVFNRPSHTTTMSGTGGAYTTDQPVR